MPELPEVEAARKALSDNCRGRVIVEASVSDDPIVIDGVSSSQLQKALVGRTVLDARRKGKNLWLELDARPWPSFQFGMTGAFHIKGKEVTKYKRSAVSDEEEWPSKFSKVFFKLDDGLEVSFTDKRRLARVRLTEDPAMVPPISELGPDAFLELPENGTFINTILKKKCPIKALLLDQSFLAGIGNWIADEVLYQARIHPEQTASSLSEAECTELHNAIEKVIKFSVEVDADSEKFPVNWIFHNRWNKKGGEVDGKKIAFITVGGRTSAYVPALQKCTSQSSRKEKKVVNLSGGEEVENDVKNMRKKKGKNESNELAKNSDNKHKKSTRTRKIQNEAEEEEIKDDPKIAKKKVRNASEESLEKIEKQGRSLRSSENNARSLRNKPRAVDQASPKVTRTSKRVAKSSRLK